MDAKWDLHVKLSKALFTRKCVGSLSRGLKIALLYKRDVSGRVTLLPETELWPASFNKTSTKRGNIQGARMFPVSVFVSKMQIMLSLHGRAF